MMKIIRFDILHWLQLLNMVKILVKKLGSELILSIDALSILFGLNYTKRANSISDKSKDPYYAV